MLINNKHYLTIWQDSIDAPVCIIDQTLLPFEFQIIEMLSLEQACHAISSMQVRGAPLIGATAAFGLVLALKEKCTEEHLQFASTELLATRPTAVNLRWAIEFMLEKIQSSTKDNWLKTAFNTAQHICQLEIERCEKIGEFGVNLIVDIYAKKKEPVNILTHCNAGWLACIDWGTALAPIYKAQQRNIPVHVWVDETRPRNQGASLTAFELLQQGIDHTVIPDNTGGHLMQHGKVDICFVGSDRTTASGDVCNKIGTYLKALAALDNNIPFYANLPSSTIDWNIDNGIKEIPIEIRDEKEVSYIQGLNKAGEIDSVRLIPEGSKAINYGFDVTPAKYITGIITEKGIFQANKDDLKNNLS